MKRTPEDEAFAVDFGRELKEHYDRATRPGVDGPGMTDEQFAASLDVKRAALTKYLKGAAMPTLRVVVFAFLRYGVKVPYLRTPLFGNRGRKQPLVSAPAQLVLPFSVQGLNTSTIQARVEAKGVNRFELRVDLQKAG
jgi:transcriptional regulator with XRE-family HTH domain